MDNPPFSTRVLLLCTTAGYVAATAGLHSPNALVVQHCGVDDFIDDCT
ncbi:MAG: hypothetical protein HKP12_02700 [Gammaproteobacteria bacterium]|nr:hypothetical protein [Gammaproteobacteria bacterium]NNJ96047.1 hypothetical protein [Gammaproteobacteria bacterium]